MKDKLVDYKGNTVLWARGGLSSKGEAKKGKHQGRKIIYLAIGEHENKTSGPN